jgi:hypothetical protein
MPKIKKKKKRALKKREKISLKQLYGKKVK